MTVVLLRLFPSAAIDTMIKRLAAFDLQRLPKSKGARKTKNSILTPSSSKQAICNLNPWHKNAKTQNNILILLILYCIKVVNSIHLGGA